jgi:hypothetical protein
MHRKGKHDDDQIEQEILIEILRSEEDKRWTRTELERALDHIEPLAISNALERLHERELLLVDGETVYAPNAEEQSKQIDMLAAVVLDTLVRAHPRPISVEDVANECERDPSVPEEQAEVELALRWLLGDELAHERDDAFAATRAAVRASELSF